MIPILTADLCILGAGAAGLSVAAGAAQMGARTVLIEAGAMGGDCLNTGCVPSKALLAAAKAAARVRGATRFGVAAGAPDIDFAAVHRHGRDTIAAIAPHDSVARFTGLGCTVIQARGHFVDGRTVEAGGRRIQARRFVIATGGRPRLPPIPGLVAVPFFTNETLFDTTVLPGHLVVIGAGPIGCEMAQAHRRLGSQVTVIDSARLLPKDDPEAAAVVRRALLADGVALIEGATIRRVEATGDGIALDLACAEGQRRITGSHLLVAAGRQPNLEALGLDAAGVRFDANGITVDARLRTSNRRIFAAGDVTGGPQFTHLAGAHAGIVLRNALFRLPARLDTRALPWVTYTDPELAQVGLTEAQAVASHGPSVRVLRADFADNDRARAEGTTGGLVKAMVTARGEILGCTMVGPQAGELIQPWVLAMAQRLKIGALAGMIAPYPTLGEISKRVAGSFYTPTLFGARTRALVRFLGRFG
jgi:pyruvate/2-oxoglutarate dehydrogenase complex dihydrolipoamide dehydrogenase (E3) component